MAIKLKKSLWRMGVFMLFLFLGLQLEAKVYAAPANPSPQELCQADGTVFTGYARGDEFFSWFEDENENIIAYDTQSGNWCYAYVQDNMPLPGPEIVGATNRTRLNFTIINRENIYGVIKSNIESSPLYVPPPEETDGPDNVYPDDGDFGEEESRIVAEPKTKQDLLLLLIEFNDVPLQKDSQYWNNQYFGSGKSVSQFYRDMSGGLDIFTPATTENIGLESEQQANVKYEGTDTDINDIPWVTEGVDVTITSDYEGVIKVKFDMPHPIPIYNGSNSVPMQLAMVTMAMKAVKENTAYDFTGFGANKQVAVIVAGTERSNSSNLEILGEVWAHTYHFDSEVVGMPGNRLPYMIHGEMYDEVNSTAIGVACHELGHTLGLPDLYNTSIGTDGIGYYSLMALGSWGCTQEEEIPGMTPVALDAWSKYMLGYIAPVEYEEKIFDTAEVKSAGEIDSTENERYNVLKVKNTKIDEKQYFLIENRQNEGWDTGLQFHFGETFSGGILILQIDENIPFDNYINASDKHRGVNIVGAPNKGAAKGNYFYAVNKKLRSLTPNSVPDSMFYSNFMSEPLLNTRDEPSNITVHIKSECSDSMIVEVGVDSEITTEFPDDNFLTEVRAAVGKNSDEPIYKSDLLNVTSLDVSFKTITSLEGIEYFRKLKELICYYNDFPTVDLSGNPELEIFDCAYNLDLTSLDVTKNTKLKELYCNYTNISGALDVSRNKDLVSLICFDCFIEELDLTHNPQLEIMDAWGNRLVSLDVTKNTKLTYLDCSFNYMTSIDDVIGWQEIGLVLGHSFVFDPQEAA